LVEIGLIILPTDTVKVVLEANIEVSILETKITVFDEAVQLISLLIAPPKVELAEAEQAPLLMDKSEGNVILIAAPVASGFLTVTVKLYVVVADTK
jgi:hypothetical protein